MDIGAFEFFVTNTKPTANAGGPYSVNEGASVMLDASKTSDAEQNPTTLTYLWDLNNNGVFGETGAAATRGDEVGIHPTFSAAGLDGPSMVTVSLKVSDTGGLVSDVAQATINVVNVRADGRHHRPDRHQSRNPANADGNLHRSRPRHHRQLELGGAQGRPKLPHPERRQRI